MWKCPKCGRTFKNTNQDHYCGEAPKTIEEYIERQSEQVQPYLRQINKIIKSAIPDTVEHPAIPETVEHLSAQEKKVQVMQDA